MSSMSTQAYGPLAVTRKQKPQPLAGSRLEGLDLARFLAFAGMVIVNFGLVFAADGSSHGWAGAVISLFEGRSAATFVVLAGIGFSLMTRDGKKIEAFPVLLKRAGFLMVIGLLNMLIFPADILHFYAVYFLLGLVFIRLNSGALLLAMGFIILFATAALFRIDYETGWNWTDYSYRDFWSVEGFLRNLMYNGFHPVLPWFAFLLFGFLLARLPLHETRTQCRMIAGGAALAAVSAIVSHALTGNATIQSIGLADVFHIKPMPPGPLYMLSGLGTASVLIGSALWFDAHCKGTVRHLLSPFLAAGRMTLSLYAGHILIGMLVLVMLGFENSGQAEIALVASAVFIVLSVIFAGFWMRSFKAGPIELLMRRLTG